MPANHCIPHSQETKDRIRASKLGVPNINGRKHPVAIDGVLHYTCTSCKQLLPLESFYKNSRRPLGIKSECKKCHCKTSIRTRDRSLSNESRRASAMNRRARLAGSHGALSVEDIRSVFRVFDGECAACTSGMDVEIDHVIPLAHRGDNLPHNLQCLCSKCNDQKHTGCADYRTDEQREQLAAISFRRIEK